MLPPCPPSPPDGPPLGTYFSRRNATQPFPPSPPLTNIFASSTNTALFTFQPAGDCGTAQYPQTSIPPQGSLSAPLSGAHCSGSPPAGLKNKTAPARTGAAEDASPLGRGLFCFRWPHIHEPPARAPVLELNVPGHQREQRVVLALRHVFARAMFASALAHDDRACVHQLPAEPLYAEPLSVGVPPVG